MKYNKGFVESLIRIRENSWTVKPWQIENNWELWQKSRRQTSNHSNKDSHYSVSYKVTKNVDGNFGKLKEKRFQKLRETFSR